ncbi:MAG: N-acetylglucosamine-6-phosphate deacetylase [Chloroflexi bacterium]|nr:N-acetylglucosamine-6-phosphate deacetylase [Chloroflexota bacterium]
MQAIVNGVIYTPTRLIPQGVLLYDAGKILAVGTRAQVPVPEQAKIIDAQGQIVCPGLVDIHGHAGDGADYVDGATEAVRTTARRHLRAGTTSMLATTSSAELEHIWQAFDCIREVMENQRQDEARLMGIHMEGPFLSLEQRGAHPPELLRMPNAAERDKLFSYVPLLHSVTLAPEREGGLQLISALVKRGVIAAGGHSDATYEQVCEAMNLGMSHTVHCWSGMSTVRRINAKRYAGMVEASLMEEGLTTEIIADGYHLPSSLMRMAYRLKGPDKLALVSDAMRASGLGPGTYTVAERTVYVDPDQMVAFTEDRKAFAGSVATMLQCVQQMVQVVGISLTDALRMATETPAHIMHLDDQIGALAPGYPADVLILDRAGLACKMVMLAGKIVYRY